MLEHRCKLCKLGLEDKSILLKIHNLRFREDVTLRSMEEKVKEIIATSENEKIKNMDPPSYVAISYHFRRHTSPRLKAKYKTQALMPALMENAKKELLDIPEVSADLKKIEKERFSLYDDLTLLYNTMKARFEAFDESQGKMINLGLPGEKGNLEGYTALSKVLKDVLSELNKMRQTEQLAKNIFNFALKEYTMLTIETIMRESEMMKKNLATHIKDGLIVEDLIEELQCNIGTHLKKGFNEVIKKTETQFNLK